MLVRQGRQKKLYRPINEMGNLVAIDVEKDEVLNNFPPLLPPQFSLVIALPKSLQSLNLKAGTGAKKTYPS